MTWQGKLYWGLVAVAATTIITFGVIYVATKESRAHWANRVCRGHGGVERWDGGYSVVCRDGTAHEG